jgi:hypothetical protein
MPITQHMVTATSTLHAGRDPAWSAHTLPSSRTSVVTHILGAPGLLTRTLIFSTSEPFLSHTQACPGSPENFPTPTELRRLLLKAQHKEPISQGRQSRKGVWSSLGSAPLRRVMTTAVVAQ